MTVLQFNGAQCRGLVCGPRSVKWTFSFRSLTGLGANAVSYRNSIRQPRPCHPLPRAFMCLRFPSGGIRLRRSAVCILVPPAIRSHADPAGSIPLGDLSRMDWDSPVRARQEGPEKIRVMVSHPNERPRAGGGPTRDYRQLSQFQRSIAASIAACRPSPGRRFCSCLMSLSAVSLQPRTFLSRTLISRCSSGLGPKAARTRSTRADISLIPMTIPF